MEITCGSLLVSVNVSVKFTRKPDKYKVRFLPGCQGTRRELTLKWRMTPSTRIEDTDNKNLSFTLTTGDRGHVEERERCYIPSYHPKAVK